jgi:long-chain acyl-CoA synthetase
VGEIVVRGPNVMQGYWNKPGETADTLRGGWLHTGDGAYMDENGYLFIVDRLKDMIVSGGENVFPAEVESVLTAHPGVAEVAVIGVPSDRWGESPYAIAVRAPGATVGADELIEYARTHLAHYKCPTGVDFVESLPRNASGKLLKTALRERYAEAAADQPT